MFPCNYNAYCIYSINCPERLFNFLTLRVGTYSRLGAYLIFTIFSKCSGIFCNNTVNANLQKAKMQQSKVSVKYSEEYSVFGRVSYYLLLEFLWKGVGWGGRLFVAGCLLAFSAFRMGAYSRWALIRGWALSRINTVIL